MKEEKLKALDRAYRQTRYLIRTDQGSPYQVEIRIGAIPKFPATWATPSRWAFLTAWNPLSEPLPPAENRRRNAQLLAAIEKMKLKVLPGEGISPDGEWREESFFVFNIGKKQAHILAEQFGQLAFVYGEGSGAAGLVYVQSVLGKGFY